MALAVLSLIADATVFSPRISLLNGEPFVVGDPFSARFKVANEGFFALRDISVEAILSGTIVGERFKDCRIDADPGPIPVLPGGQAYDQWFKIIVAGGSKDADWAEILAAIKFKPPFVWWHNTITQRFVTVRTLDGKFHWEKRPVR